MSDLVTCRRCRSRTTPTVAHQYWPQGLCRCCQDPQEGEAVRRSLERAPAEFLRQDAERMR